VQHCIREGELNLVGTGGKEKVLKIGIEARYGAVGKRGQRATRGKGVRMGKKKKCRKICLRAKQTLSSKTEGAIT